MPQNIKSNIKVKLSDFSKGINTKLTENLLPLNYAVNCYNFDFNKCSLSTGLGIQELSIPYADSNSKTFMTPASITQIRKFWQYTRYDNELNDYIPLLIMYGDDNKLYYARLKTSLNTFTLLDSSFENVPNGINYRIDDGDCFLACGESKMLKFSGSNAVTFSENIPKITSVALHAGRLFATVSGDQNVIWFSDDLNPTNWNVSNFEGGYIELTGERGVCKKVIEANNYLYVIREYGISRISGWGLQDDFAVKNMYLSTGKLYHNTAKLCGHIIIMLCSDGLYYFDGGSMNKINLGIEEMFEGVDNSKAFGAFLDGKYYIACKMNYNDSAFIGCEGGSYDNNTLIELDLNTFDINILRGVDIAYMDGIRYDNYSKLGIICKGNNGEKFFELTHDGKIDGVATKKHWCSPFTDIGYPDYKKAIKSITLCTKTDIKILVNADGRKYVYDVKGSKSPVKVPINVCCTSFNIAFESTVAECEISDPIIHISLV